MAKMKLVLGVAPIKRAFLSMEEANRHKTEILKTIKGLTPTEVELVDIDGLSENGIAFELDKVAAITDRFIDRRVDALFLPFCDFGEESVAAAIAARLKVPTLVWGPRDETPNSFAQRGRDTQCGIIAATKVLRRCGVTYSYIVGCPTAGEAFQNGYLTFLRAAMVVKTARTLKVAQIGHRPQTFLSVIANEGELIEKLGIQCVPISVGEITAEADKLMARQDPELEDYYKDFTARVDCSPMEKSAADPEDEFYEEAQDGVRRTLAQTLAIRNAVSQAGCGCASIDCWSSYETWRGTPCVSIGELAGAGLPIACEGDINGAVTLALLNACDFGRSPQFFADLTIRHPQNDNAELLWHCGPFPYALKDPNAKATMRGFNGCWELKKGDMTICRFDCVDGEYYLFVGEGRATDGPETTGTYVWLETDNWPQWEEKLVFGPYIHHVGGIYGRYLPALREAARYLGLHFDTPGMPEVHAL